MRYVAEECREEGAARAILWAIAYRADRDTGECWAGQRRIARESGFTRTHVQRVIPQLLRRGVLEVVESGTGPRPDVLRIAPAWVEGDGGGSGMVEAEAGVSRVVEGQGGIAGEVIHRPEATGHTMSPLEVAPGALVATSWPPTGHIGDPLVATSGSASGHMKSRLPAETAPKGFEGLEAREGQVLDAAGSTADAAGGVEAAYEPPPVDEATRTWLRHRGLGQKRPPPLAHTPTAVADPAVERNREQQLAELERRYPEEFKTSQEGKESA